MRALLVATFLIALSAPACGRIDFDPIVRAGDSGADDANGDDGGMDLGPSFDASADANDNDGETDLGAPFDASGDAEQDSGIDLGTDGGMDMAMPPTPHVIVAPVSGLITSELGTTDEFTLELIVAPSSDVTISVSSGTPTEVSVSTSTITFTASNYATPQAVTVTGINDSVADGDQPFTIVLGDCVSADAAYSGLSVDDVSGTNEDIGGPAIIVTPTSGGVTTESGLAFTFMVRLATLPTANVDVPIVSSDESEGEVDPASLTFTAANWFTPQTVTVSGVDDFIADGSQMYVVHVGPAVSADAFYSGLAGADVSLTNDDNDTSGITVSPSGGLTTTESHGTATFSISLTSSPEANVTIALSSDNTAEGTVTPASLTFTALNWYVAQTVTAHGVNDSRCDGAVAYHIVTGAAVSTDASYAAIDPRDVDVTNLDNDVPMVDVTPTAGLSTSEAGASTSFTMSLSCDPIEDVSITLSVSDVTEGSVLPVSALFTSADWATPQTISITGAHDAILDGNMLYSVVTSNASSSGAFGGVSVADPTVTNLSSAAQQAYIKASNAEAGDRFSDALAVSGDGNTIAVGEPNEDSNATGIGGNQADNSATDAGAVYVFVRSAGVWSQQAYIKASNAQASDQFGFSVALSFDGSTLVVGAPGERSSATGVGGAQGDNSLAHAGAAYVFTRSAGVWSQQAYVKASNTNANDWFGNALSLSSSGDTLAVAAYSEDSNATGVGGNAADNSAANAGAVYLFRRLGIVWSQQAYVKATNTDSNDAFGFAVALSGDGATLAVGALSESSASTGVGGLQSDNSAGLSGAVYVYAYSAAWTPTAYIKASNTDAGDQFGTALALSEDGRTLAVAARSERSWATGVGGDQLNNVVAGAGAVYVFRNSSGWSQQAYVKAINPSPYSGGFGASVSLDASGDRMAVGSYVDNSGATGLFGDAFNSAAAASGAAHIFGFRAGVWAEEVYVKASNAESSDNFAFTGALSRDGATYVAGAFREDSNATGIGGDETNNAAMDSGAIYVFAAN
ncbi:MAG: hypothetical protein IPK60_08565 [Sandaracinaceae bacterium]|nr:hypothetical protein [Sandaracinaceae bacterium]